MIRPSGFLSALARSIGRGPGFNSQFRPFFAVVSTRIMDTVLYVCLHGSLLLHKRSCSELYLLFIAPPASAGTRLRTTTVMPREIVTVQMGQCGNQSERINVLVVKLICAAFLLWLTLNSLSWFRVLAATVCRTRHQQGRYFGGI